MNKIALIIPYFGKLPNYFQLFLNSCRYNSDIDWLLYTDDKTDYKYPSNVIVKYCTLTELHNTINEKMGFKVCLPQSYKLCDYRPAYGYIFEEDLKAHDYTFWGHCDIDLIFGNLSKFISDTMLEEYDKLFFKGHFSLYRNIPYMNKLFMTPINGEDYWKKVYSSKLNYGFDENGIDDAIGMYTIFRQEQLKLYEEPVYASLNITKEHFELSVYPYDNTDEKKNKNTVFSWKNGMLSRHFIRDGKVEQKEYMYLHLQAHPMKNTFEWNQEPNEYLIVPNKFITISNGEINRKILIKYGYKRIIYLHFWKKRCRRVISRLRTWGDKNG